MTTNSNLENIYNLSQLIRILTVAIDYLNEPANGVHRVGAIAIVSLKFCHLSIYGIIPHKDPIFFYKICYEFSFAFQRVQYLDT